MIFYSVYMEKKVPPLLKSFPFSQNLLKVGPLKAVNSPPFFIPHHILRMDSAILKGGEEGVCQPRLNGESNHVKIQKH